MLNLSNCASSNNSKLLVGASENYLDAFALECVRQKVACRMWLVPPMEAFTEPGLAEQVVSEMKNIMPTIITTTDLTPVLQPQGTDLYFTSDPHWNSNGHQVVADLA